MPAASSFPSPYLPPESILIRAEQAAKHTPAQHIFTVEADATLAAAARAVSESNACHGRVSVIGPRLSTALRVGLSGADLPCRADVIVMEIFDSMLLGEGVLPTMADAVARLLADDGVVIPARGTLVGMLVEAPTLAQGARPTDRTLDTRSSGG